MKGKEVEIKKSFYQSKCFGVLVYRDVYLSLQVWVGRVKLKSCRSKNAQCNERSLEPLLLLEPCSAGMGLL